MSARPYDWAEYESSPWGPLLGALSPLEPMFTIHERSSMRFRKKPVVIEATQWFKNGDPEDGVGELVKDPLDNDTAYERKEGVVVRHYRHPDDDGERLCEHCGVRMHDHGWIDTLEGGHNVCPGDWVITGVQGERYPCKPDIFDATYEPAD